MKVLCTGASGFIGTHLTNRFVENGIDFINIDIKAPKESKQTSYWKECNILDHLRLVEIFQDYSPTHVVHLAARADTDSNQLEDYRDNTEGTHSVLQAIQKTSTVSRVIITSTQFVHRPGHLPENDEDFEPHTTYGQSKVIAEQLTRSAHLTCCWTIIRPTNIWGPWHPRYPMEFLRVLKQGRYFHPGRQPVVRVYGYVGNVIYQIEKILEAPALQIDGRVFYLGDRPVNIYEWVNGFSNAILGKDVRIVPKSFVRCMALFGDLLSFFGYRFPINSSRFKSMTTDYLVPIEPTFEAFGEPPYSLLEGISITVKWLQLQEATAPILSSD